MRWKNEGAAALRRSRTALREADRRLGTASVRAEEARPERAREAAEAGLRELRFAEDILVRLLAEADEPEPTPKPPVKPPAPKPPVVKPPVVAPPAPKPPVVAPPTKPPVVAPPVTPPTKPPVAPPAKPPVEPPAPKPPVVPPVEPPLRPPVEPPAGPPVTPPVPAPGPFPPSPPVVRPPAPEGRVVWSAAEANRVLADGLTALVPEGTRLEGDVRVGSGRLASQGGLLTAAVRGDVRVEHRGLFFGLELLGGDVEMVGDDGAVVRCAVVGGKVVMQRGKRQRAVFCDFRRGRGIGLEVVGDPATACLQPYLGWSHFRDPEMRSGNGGEAFRFGQGWSSSATPMGGIAEFLLIEGYRRLDERELASFKANLNVFRDSTIVGCRQFVSNRSGRHNSYERLFFVDSSGIVFLDGPVRADGCAAADGRARIILMSGDGPVEPLSAFHRDGFSYRPATGVELRACALPHQIDNARQHHAARPLVVPGPATARLLTAAEVGPFAPAPAAPPAPAPVW